MKLIPSLGPLERQVMICLWNHQESSVREIHFRLKKRRRIAYTTILTILDRLHHKGFVLRKKQGKAYAYTARFNKKQIVKNLLRKTLNSITEKYGVDSIAAFVDELRELPLNQRKKLIEMLKQETSD